jgi:cellobiose phosphorylase
LSKEPDEIGRTRIFPAGWLENGSVWLHMEYKYFLELLRGGLAKEFFAQIHRALVPFLDPMTYGRSILQNSSFIVSSVHEDKNYHGRGFVARLSGSTAEFLHMWLVMNLGVNPFVLDDQNRLTLGFNPLLPSWLFTDKAQGEFAARTYSFKLFAKTMVTYHNPKAQKIVLTYPDCKSIEIAGGVLNEPLSLEVREGKLKNIDVYLN